MNQRINEFVKFLSQKMSIVKALNNSDLDADFVADHWSLIAKKLKEQNNAKKKK